MRKDYDERFRTILYGQLQRFAFRGEQVAADLYLIIGLQCLDRVHPMRCVSVPAIEGEWGEAD